MAEAITRHLAFLSRVPAITADDRARFRAEQAAIIADKQAAFAAREAARKEQ